MLNWQSRIAADPKVLVGKPIIKGTRIAVEFLIELMAEDIQAALFHAAELMKLERAYPLPA